MPSRQQGGTHWTVTFVIFSTLVSGSSFLPAFFPLAGAVAPLVLFVDVLDWFGRALAIALDSSVV
jgi:hypothetical protein